MADAIVGFLKDTWIVSHNNYPIPHILEQTNAIKWNPEFLVVVYQVVEYACKRKET